MIKKSDIKFKIIAYSGKDVGGKRVGARRELFAKLDYEVCCQADVQKDEITKGHAIRHIESFLYGEILDELLPLRQMCLAGGAQDIGGIDNSFNKIISMLKIK